MAGSYRNAGTGIALLLVLAGLNAAYAQDTILAAFKQANAAISHDLSKGKAPAGMSNPAYAKQVSQAFDLAVAEIAKDEPISSILDICGEAIKTRTQYMLFGLKQEIANTAEAEKVVRAMQVKSRNILRFQDEMTAAMRFEVACLAKMAMKLDAFLGQLKAGDLSPVRRAAVQQLQRGMVEVVSGLALNQLDDFRADNRQILLDALVRNIGPYTAAMTTASRRAAVANVEKVLLAPTISLDAKEKLRKVLKALNRTDCGTSCSFQ